MTVVAVESDIDNSLPAGSLQAATSARTFTFSQSSSADILGVPRAANRAGRRNLNDYTFERTVEFSHISSAKATGRIDLYKKNCFLMEAKQSREKGRPKALSLPGQLDLLEADYQPRGQRSANRAWDQLMIAARRQAEEYARAIARDHAWPPFVLICDVGHCIEVYADFYRPGQKLRAISRPARLSHLHAGAARRENPRAPAAHLAKAPTHLDPARQSRKGDARHHAAACRQCRKRSRRTATTTPRKWRSS